jgi:hypothetical protein
MLGIMRKLFRHAQSEKREHCQLTFKKDIESSTRTARQPAEKEAHRDASGTSASDQLSFAGMIIDDSAIGGGHEKQEGECQKEYCGGEPT